MNDHRSSDREKIATVRRIYPTAVSLVDYVTSLTNCDIAQIVTSSDTTKYQMFVKTTVVVPQKKMSGSESLSICRNDQLLSTPVRDFLNRFVAQIVKSNLPFREQNCLSYGYRSKSSFNNCGMRSHAGLECYFVNTLHNIVTSALWQLFSSRVGEQLYCAMLCYSDIHLFLLHLISKHVWRLSSLIIHTLSRDCRVNHFLNEFFSMRSVTIGEQVMKLILSGPVFMQCASAGGCYIQVRTANFSNLLIRWLPFTQVMVAFLLSWKIVILFSWDNRHTFFMKNRDDFFCQRPHSCSYE